MAERSRLLRDSVLVLDGYTGFTPVQYRLLGQLLKLCREMYVTVTATGDTDLYGPGDEADLFDMSRKMAEMCIRDSLQVRLNELCPWVPLYYKSNMVGRRADLKGFQFNKNTALHYLGDCYFEK